MFIFHILVNSLVEFVLYKLFALAALEMDENLDLLKKIDLTDSCQ